VRIRAELREHITVADATLMWTDETALEALLAPLFPAAFAAKAAEDGAPAAAALPDEDGLPSASRGDAPAIASPAGAVSATGPAASA